MNLTMSQKERDRLAVIRAVEARHITQKEAANQLGITDRQVRRILRRYRTEGDGGLIHRSRGRPSNRRIAPEIQKRAVGLLNEHYSDFGPTLAAETLAERHDINVSKETVRKWMIHEGLHTPKQRTVTHLTWRERRPCFGEMLQIDGSQEAWLEGRSHVEPELINAVDDATGRAFMRFAPAETTEAVMRLLYEYIGLYGRPLALYADRHSIYQTTRDASVDEQLQGLESQTQVGRALRELDIQYIPAGSPQAKGRVERSFGTLQDRLIKQLRLEGINDMPSANRFVKEHFNDDYNSRFAIQPASPHDAHRPVGNLDLDAILSHQETRTVTNDYTIRYHNSRYQIARQSVVGGLRGAKVIVECRLDGSIHVRFRDEYLDVTQLPPPQPKADEPKAPTSRRKPTPVTPADDHPWRQGYRQMPKRPIHP